MATYCGQNFGKLDTARIRSGVRVATVMGLIFALVAGGLSIHYGSYLLGVAGDPAAWMLTGTFGIFAYLYVMRDVERRYHLGKYADSEER